MAHTMDRLWDSPKYNIKTSLVPHRRLRFHATRRNPNYDGRASPRGWEKLLAERKKERERERGRDKKKKEREKGREKKHARNNALSDPLSSRARDARAFPRGYTFIIIDNIVIANTYRPRGRINKVPVFYRNGNDLHSRARADAVHFLRNVSRIF